MKGPKLPNINSPDTMALRTWVRDAIIAEQKTLEQPRLPELESTLVRGRLEALRAIERSVTPTEKAAE